MPFKILQFTFLISFAILVSGYYGERPYAKRERYQRYVDPYPLNPFDPLFGKKLNSHIHRQVNEQLSRSMDFADAINQQVQIQLAPVHRMQLRLRMAQGTGGTTVITYGDKNYRFVIDGTTYYCPSKEVVKQENGPPKCTENLKLDNLDDPCIFSGKAVSIMGDFYCFGNHVMMSCINENCTCQGGKVYTTRQLKEKCGENFRTSNYARYEYYPDILGVGAIDFNSPANQALNLCDYSDQYSCVWNDNGIISV